MDNTETYKTLRDEIAITAMACLIQNDKYDEKQTAEVAYKYADAMLKAREAGK